MYERIRDEYIDLNINPIENYGATIGLINEGCYNDWKISLLGPKDTSYKGGVFFLNAHFPPEYPNKPPEIHFLTPIYHVNVNPTISKDGGSESLGHICISTLNWWKPQYKMREVLLNIYSLFFMANPDSAYGIDRAKEFNEERSIYEEKVKFFTKKYADPFNVPKQFDRSKNWDFNLSIN